MDKMQDNDNIEDEDLELCPYTVYYSEGIRLLTAQKWDKAIEKFEMVLEIKPDHLKTLIARSKCYLATGENEEALSDIDKALEINPDSFSAVLTKAEILYNMGQFEQALRYFQRGVIHRPKVAAFRVGAQEATAAIINAIAHEDTLKFDHPVRILKLVAKREKETKITKKVRVHPAFKTKKKKKKLRDRDPQTAKLLLGRLYPYKVFFQDLLSHPDLVIGEPNERTDRIIEIAKDGLNFLKERQEVYLQEKPLFCREREDREMRLRRRNQEPDIREIKLQMERKKLEDLTNHFTEAVTEVERVLQDKDYKETKKMCLRLLQSLAGTDEVEMLDKYKMVAQVYILTGKACLFLGAFDEALTNFREALEIAKEHCVMQEQYNAIFYLAKAHACSNNYSKAIILFEPLIPYSKKPELRAVLFHHIAECYFRIENYEAAEFFALKCIEASYEAPDPKIETLRVCAALLKVRSEVINGVPKHSLSTLRDVISSLTGIENEDVLSNLMTLISKNADLKKMGAPEIPAHCQIQSGLMETLAPTVATGPHAGEHRGHKD